MVDARDGMSRSGFHHLTGLQATVMTKSECILAPGRENGWFRPLEEVARRNNLPRNVVEPSSLEVFKVLLDRVLDNIV